MNQPAQADGWVPEWRRVRTNTTTSNPSHYRSDDSVMSSVPSGEHEYSDTDSERAGDYRDPQATPLHSPVEPSIDVLSTNPPLSMLSDTEPVDSSDPPPPPTSAIPPGFLHGVSTQVVDTVKQYLPWLFVSAIVWQTISISPCKIKHLLTLLKHS